jgi:hypothetical protein
LVLTPESPRDLARLLVRRFLEGPDRGRPEIESA